MKPELPCLLWVALLVCALVCPAHARVKTLVVTGGHDFDQASFFRMFSDNPDLDVTTAAHASRTNATVFEREDLLSYDVVILYDMQAAITAAQKAAFMSLFKKGVGLVVLHHALVSYPDWAEYETIIGGRYQEPDPKSPGKVTEEVGWQHGIDFPVVITTTNHPVTAGIGNFQVHDEIYWGFRVGDDVTPLITTTHPKSGKPLGWARTEGKSRVVFIQVGHGKEAFDNPSYRKLLAQSIQWVSTTEAVSKTAIRP